MMINLADIYQLEPLTRKENHHSNGAKVELADEIGFSPHALFILKERFLRQNEKGETIETPSGMFRRVARALAAVEATPIEQKRWEQIFYRVMTAMEFHPSSRILSNAGSIKQQLANCFVFPVPDSQAGIFKTLQDSAIIKSHGGGCGFNFSAVRPKGDMVRGEANLAVGPVGLLKLFDMTSAMFRQQGQYISGNMVVLNVDHPDILEFIAAKDQDGELSLTNLSLGITNDFMQAVIDDNLWSLTNPHTHSVTQTIPARTIFQAACQYAQKTGDPGMLFLDHINKDNPLYEHMGDIIATNPCGEIGLYPYEACNLGYLNLTKFLLPPEVRTTQRIFDEERLRQVVSIGVRMIDNAISASWFPIPEIQEVVRANRRIGLGLTGWADCLAISEIVYDSEESLKLAENLASTILAAAQQTTLTLGREKGPFPNVDQSIWQGRKDQPRNVALLAFPPSGNNAIIFDTSFSIEPFFALVYSENIMGGVRLDHINPYLVGALQKAGLYKKSLIETIKENHGSIQHIPEIPDNIKRCFKVAHDIDPDWHVRMTATFQKYVDNAITKTVNLPANSSAADVEHIFKLAWQLGCKGITVYRDESRFEQTIDFSSKDNKCDSLVCAHCD